MADSVLGLADGIEGLNTRRTILRARWRNARQPMTAYQADRAYSATPTKLSSAPDAHAVVLTATGVVGWQHPCQEPGSPTRLWGGTATRPFGGLARANSVRARVRPRRAIAWRYRPSASSPSLSSACERAWTPSAQSVPLAPVISASRR